MSWFRTERERPEPTPVLEYRAPPGTQTIDNSEEFERFRRCVEEGKDPIEGRHSYTGRGIRHEHLPSPPSWSTGPHRGPRPSTTRRSSKGSADAWRKGRILSKEGTATPDAASDTSI